MSRADNWKTFTHQNDQRETTTINHASILPRPSRRNVHHRMSAWPTPSETSRNSPRVGNEQPRQSSLTNNNTPSENNTPFGLEEERSTGSTRFSTVTSRSTMNLRLQEIDSLLKTHHKQMEMSGKKAADRISTLERQFNRIDDIDKTMVAVKLNLENTNKATTCSQQKMENNLQEMKKDTAKQFEEVRSNVLNTRESQQMMSTTLMDMRNQFNTLSKLMMVMGHKLDIVMKGVTTAPVVPQAPTDQSRNSKRTQCEVRSISVVKGQHNTLNDEFHESSTYPSPDPKKHRTRVRPMTLGDTKDNVTMDYLEAQYQISTEHSEAKMYETDYESDTDHESGKEREPDEHMFDTSEVCLNLEEAFDKILSDDQDSQSTTTELNLSSPAIEVATNQQFKQPRQAPLNHQYIKTMDSAGAKAS